LFAEVVNYCPPIFVPYGRVVLSNGVQQGSEAHFICDPFYSWTSANYSRCLEGGQWSGQIGRCGE